MQLQRRRDDRSVLGNGRNVFDRSHRQGPTLCVQLDWKGQSESRVTEIVRRTDLKSPFGIARSHASETQAFRVFVNRSAGRLGRTVGPAFNSDEGVRRRSPLRRSYRQWRPTTPKGSQARYSFPEAPRVYRHYDPRPERLRRCRG